MACVAREDGGLNQDSRMIRQVSGHSSHFGFLQVTPVGSSVVSQSHRETPRAMTTESLLD